MEAQSHGSGAHSLSYDRRAAEADAGVWKTAACGFAGSPKSHRLFIWFSVKDPCGKGRPREKKRGLACSHLLILFLFRDEVHL